MSSYKPIPARERRRQDAIRLNALRQASSLQASLLRARASEVRRVLDLCKNYDDKNYWSVVISRNINEQPYFEKWERRLFEKTALPYAETVARDLTKKKAAPSFFTRAIAAYAATRVGEMIVSVTGTLKKQLISILFDELLESPTIGVEALVKHIRKEYNALAAWQVRRIAQTETMIGLGRAGHAAAESLDVPYLKQWCTSGMSNVRETHAEMDGHIVEDKEPFIFDDGILYYPHDTEHGAPASEIINCACACIRLPR